MKEELFDGALVVKDGDALASALGKLPYLEVKRKDWKRGEGAHQWRVMVRQRKSWVNTLKHYLGMDRIVFIDGYGREEKEPHWVSYGDGWSPLANMRLLPSFNAIREYVGVLEDHVDLNYEYEAKRKKGLIETGIVIATVLAFTPFLWQMLQILPTCETNPGLEVIVETLPLYVGWALVGIAVSFLVWHNLMVLAGFREKKWWIFTSYIRRGAK